MDICLSSCYGDYNYVGLVVIVMCIVNVIFVVVVVELGIWIIFDLFLIIGEGWYVVV